MTAPGPRTRAPQIVLEVLERVQLAPHMVRIVAGGPAVADIDVRGHTDMYTKMLFTPPGSQLVPPYDLPALRERLPVEALPSTRTYTLRRVDADRHHVWIDFVVHGASGVAGPWADRAEPGDAVVLGGVGGGYAPDPDAGRHLLAGDESALPAIASALEALVATAPSARGTALIEVGSEADHLDLAAPDGVDVRWLHRDGAEAGTTSLLADAVRGLGRPDDRVQVFAHGERGAMKALRPYLTDECGLDRSRLSLSAYWAHGRREDAFQAEKREPAGQV